MPDPAPAIIVWNDYQNDQVVLIRAVIACAVMLPVLAGCGGSGPREDWGWQGGTTRAAFEQDHAGCRMEAAQRIPAVFAPVVQPAPQTTVNVMTPRPGLNFSDGSDLTRFMPAQDRNAVVREDAYRLCMMQRGYRWVRNPSGA